MKNIIIAVLLILALALAGVLWRRVSVLEAAAAPANDYPFGEVMGYMQRYADKIWFAAEAGNWDLARYYHDEIAETADNIVAAHLVKDGAAVSDDMHAMFAEPLQAVNAAITARDATLFKQRYGEMINTCNACHVATNHPFIRVGIPHGPPAWWNQDFSVSH